MRPISQTKTPWFTLALPLFNIGASFKVGEQDPTLKTSRFEMAKQIKDLQADNASLRADNEELRAEVNEIKAALQKLQ